MLANAQHRSAAMLLGGFLICYCLVAAYLRSACHRDPSSIFFRPDTAHVLQYSAFRKVEARRFAAAQGQKLLEHGGDSVGRNSTTAPATRPDICVGISSVSRHGFSYLRETLGSVLEGLDPLERQRVHVVAFLAHANQSRHEDHGQPWLRAMADSLPTYPADDGTAALVRELEDGPDSGSYSAHARKQKLDYTVLLEECARVRPRYTMTLEDDVIALDGWYHRVMEALRVATEKTREMGKDSFLYLRIFYDGRLLGWNSEEWPSYAAYSSAALLALAGALLLARRRWPKARSGLLGPAALAVLVGVCFPMSVGLFFAAGRHCVAPRAAGVELMSRYGCCAQGLVFPQAQVDGSLLPLYRGSRGDGHAAVDTFLEDHAERSGGLLRWAVTPVLIQHVGGKSSHGAGDQVGGRLTDDMPFDYDFEANDAGRLADEHAAAVEEMAARIARGGGDDDEATEAV